MDTVDMFYNILYKNVYDLCINIYIDLWLKVFAPFYEKVRKR